MAGLAHLSLQLAWRSGVQLRTLIDEYDRNLVGGMHTDLALHRKLYVLTLSCLAELSLNLSTYELWSKGPGSEMQLND